MFIDAMQLLITSSMIIVIISLILSYRERKSMGQMVAKSKRYITSPLAFLLIVLLFLFYIIPSLIPPKLSIMRLLPMALIAVYIYPLIIRTAIFEDGIVFPLKVYRWSRVSSYRWNNNHLYFDIKIRYFGKEKVRTMGVEFSDTLKQDVDDILKQNITCSKT